MPTLTPQIIAAAIKGFETQKVEIDGKIADLRALLLPAPVTTAPTTEAPTAKKKHTMSAAGRRNVRAALKKRWAAFHAEKAAKSKGKGRAASA